MYKGWALVCSALLVFSLLPFVNSQNGSSYKFYTQYQKAESPTLKPLSDGFIEARPYDEVARAMSDVFNLPRNVGIVTMECGVSNAFYDPSTASMHLCYELMDQMINTFTNAGYKDPGYLAGFAFWYIFYHELGHALINIYDLDVLAAEEDVADNFATLMSIWGGGTDTAINAAVWWKLTATQANETAFADVHSLNQQRFYNILCLVYGSDPDQFSALVKDGYLPESRASNCPYEYSQATKSWGKQLSPYIRQSEQVLPEIRFNKVRYNISDKEVIISVIDVDANTMQDAKDAIDVYIWTTSDPRGMTLKFPETAPNTGIFEKTIKLNTLKLSPSDELTVEYTPPHSYGSIASKSVPIGATTSQTYSIVPASNLQVLDTFDNPMRTISVDEMAMVKADLTNKLNKDQPFAYIVQIQDKDGVTVSMSVLTGSLRPAQSFNAGISWIPVTSGTYTATVFVWSSLMSPTSLSPPVSVNIVVQR
jgi:hypothetical protein